MGYHSVADPRIEDPGDVIVGIRRAAICGSDLHVYHGRERGLDVGTVMGHEFAGEIVDTGRHVTRLRMGDRVMSPFTTSCGLCFYCQRGLTSRCPRGLLFGWVEKGRGLQGAQAEWVRVPLAESTLVACPDDVSWDEAVLMGDILPTGYFSAQMAEVAPGGSYAILGCGPVGLLAVLSAMELGAEAVYAVDAIPARLQKARDFGAESLDYSASDVVASIRERTEGRGVDGVLEAVGTPSATRLAVDLVRPGGIIAAVGVHTEDRFSFSPVEAYDKNLTYRAGRCPAREYMERLTPLLRNRKKDLRSLVTHRMTLEDGAEGYQIFDEKRDDCLKVLLEPG